MFSTPSFEQQLAEFPAPRISADRETIARSRNHADAEKVWRTLKELKPDLQAPDLIRAVLSARRSASATVDRTNLFKQEWQWAFPRLRRNLSTLPSNLGPLEVAAILERTADDLRDLHKLHFAFSDQAQFTMSLKDHKGSRKRKLFTQILGTHLHVHDSDMATLADIAFPGEEASLTDQDRSRRRPNRALERKNRG